LLIGVEAHEVRFVWQAGLLEHDRDLDSIGGRQRIELDALRMLGRPFVGYREISKTHHVNAPSVTNASCSHPTRSAHGRAFPRAIKLPNCAPSQKDPTS